MTDTNPLFDKKEIEAGPVKMVLEPTHVPGRDVVYQVIISFPLEQMRLYCSKWVNPLRVALEAADEALNALKCEIYAQELNEGKPYEKAKDEEKKDGQ